MPIRRIAKQRHAQYTEGHVHQLRTGHSFEFLDESFGNPAGELTTYSTFFKTRLYSDDQLSEMKKAWPDLRDAVFSGHTADRSGILPFGWWICESTVRPNEDWWHYHGQSEEESRYLELEQLLGMRRSLPKDILAIVNDAAALVSVRGHD